MAKVKRTVKKAVKGKSVKISEKTGEFPLIGRYVILRGYYAGVHAGFLVDYDVANDMAILKDARRLWGWTSKFSLSEAAMTGVTKGKIETTISAPMMMRQIFEIIPCTKEAELTIRNMPDAVASNS